jgi:hypothetical protein
VNTDRSVTFKVKAESAHRVQLLMELGQSTFENASKINQQLKLLWIGIGRDDFLHSPVLESHEALERAGIKHVWIESSGAHV